MEGEAQVSCRKGKRHRLEDAEGDILACAMQTKKVKTHADLKDSHEGNINLICMCSGYIWDY